MSDDITPRMVEAAAIAIWQTFACRSGRARRTWAEVPAHLKNEYRAEARAAIEAALGTSREAAA